MVDLHLHTTASDGRLTPVELVARVAAARVTVMAVTDHDTMAAVRDTAALARDAGIESIPGIEITAVEDGRDVHVLGYFLDPDHAGLAMFLAAQRRARVSRIEAIGRRLAELGLHVDLAPLLEEAARDTGRALGRPQVARALVAAGHARDTNDAFERLLERGRPAFIARSGTPAVDVIATIHAAGGLASLAHPGVTGIDDRIPGLKDAGLDALEVFHSDHDAGATARYSALADRLGLLMTGGSDFHGDPSHGAGPGSTTLPLEHWHRLREAWRG